MQITELCARTQTEAMVLVVRGKYDHINQPWTFCTNPKIEQFFNMIAGRELGDFAHKLESYCLSGAGAAADTAEDQLNKLRTQTITLIAELLGMWSNPSTSRVTNTLYRTCCKPQDLANVLQGVPHQDHGVIRRHPRKMAPQELQQSQPAQLQGRADGPLQRIEERGDQVPPAVGDGVGRMGRRGQACRHRNRRRASWRRC